MVHFDVKLTEKLKLARSALKLSQAEVAKRVGTYQQRYQHWESGHTRPDPDELSQLSKALGVTTDWLLGSDEKEKPYPKDFDKEMFLLKEDLKKYGPESVKRIRKMLPLIFEHPTRKN